MESQSSGTQNQSDWIKSNQGIAVCLTAVVAVLLIYLFTSDWVFMKLRDGFHLGTFTVVSTFAMLACTLAMIVDKHRHVADADVVKAGWLDWIVAIASAVVCLAYFHLAWNFDFLLVSPVFLAAGMYTLGVRPVRSAITSAVIMTVIIYGLFRLIGIELPSVIIWF